MLPVVMGGARIGQMIARLRSAGTAAGVAASAKIKDFADFLKKLVDKIKTTNFDISRLKSAAKRAGVDVKGKSKEGIKTALIRKVKQHPILASLVAFELFGPSSEFVIWAYENVDGADEVLEKVEAEKATDGVSEIPDEMVDGGDRDQTPAEAHTQVVSGMEAKRPIFETIGRVSAAIGGDERLRELRYVMSLDLKTLDEYFELKSMRSVFR